MKEAPLEQTGAGLVPLEDGWFVVNVRDALWVTNEAFGAACLFDGPNELFPQVGLRLRVLVPGRPNAMYHSEGNQEDFLVLAGECLLLVEGVERRLRAWDFVHCPGGTEHVFVGAGDGPCVVLMTGSREGWPESENLRYPRSEVAVRHGAGVEAETTDPREAYGRFPDWQGLPQGPAGMPWSDG